MSRVRRGVIGRRLYRLILRMLPTDFRREYGRDMEETFLAARAEAVRSGGAAAPRLWFREAMDLARTGASLRGERALTAAAPHVACGASWLALLGDDLRLASTSLFRHRRFFALAAVTLALGVGATTAMYGALRSVVLDPLPFPTSDRLVTLWREFGDARLGLDADHLAALRADASIFDGIEAYSSSAVTLTGVDEPVRINAIRVTPGVPALMGVAPVLGRTFTAEETVGEGAHVVVLSYGFWRSRFGGSRNALGATIQLNGEPWTIVGVMPRQAVRPDGSLQRLDVWLPLGDGNPARATLARLAEGVPIDVATARVDAVVRAGGEGPYPGLASPIAPTGPIHDHLRILMVAVSLLLMAACVNVANLLLQRATARRAETAIRSALGASRTRLFRQFAFESLILAAVGAVLGIGLAHLALGALTAIRPDQLEALREVRIDRQVLLFCIAISAGAGLLFGLVPAVAGSRVEATAALGRAGRGVFPASARLRWALVSAEIALSFALLVGAALVVSSLREISVRSPGFRADDLIAVDVRLPSWRYPTAEGRGEALEQISAAIRRLPRVEAVSLANSMPPRVNVGFVGHVEVEGYPPESIPSRFQTVEAEPDYLETLGIPLLAGRPLAPEDARADTRNVVLSESAARRLFPGEDAVGRRFRVGIEMNVVGIASDIRTSGLADDAREPVFYLPLRRAAADMTIAVRAVGIDARLLDDLRQTVRQAEPDAIIDVATLNERLHASVARERFTTAIISTFATLTLLLAAIGIYGVLWQVVAARTREIGLRISLGATGARIGALVVRWGSVATAAGLVAGALLAWAGLRILQSEIFGLAQHRPSAYAAAALVLIGMAGGAMLVPAWRAARMSPLRALGVE